MKTNGGGHNEVSQKNEGRESTSLGSRYGHAAFATACGSKV